jgi:hypothetical protein
LFAKRDRSAVRKTLSNDRIFKKLGARFTLDDQNWVIGVSLGERKVTDADLVHLSPASSRT